MSTENVVKQAPEWTPVRDGDRYCSPACGGRCRFADYEAATAKAAELAARLTDHFGVEWTPRVWENLGWHYKAIRGRHEVGPQPRVGGYWVSLIFEGVGQLHTAGPNPITIIEQLVDGVRISVERVALELGVVAPGLSKGERDG